MSQCGHGDWVVGVRVGVRVRVRVSVRNRIRVMVMVRASRLPQRELS